MRSVLAAIFISFLLFGASACSVPLAPGYRILKESREVRFMSGPPSQLRIRARYTLQNTGSRELTFLDATFPDERIFGRRNLRVEVDGREAALGKLPEEYQQSAPHTHRIAIDPPWAQKQRRELTIEYDFSSPEDSGTRITLGEASFHIGSRGWVPVLEPPRNFLAPFPKRPDRMMYTVRVPSGFLVLARGTASGRKQDGDEIEYRFELRKDDLAPYIVAGKYAESASREKSGGAVFWTREPLKENATAAEEQIASTWTILQKDFGPLDKHIQLPHVVESPELRAHFAGEDGPAASSFPGGALVNPAALALGMGTEPFLERITHALVHNWFSDEVYAAPEAVVGLGEGLPEYATIVIDEARKGEAARYQRVIERLHEYDEARKRTAEKPLGLLVVTDSLEQRRIGFAKAPLFFVALEDRCGQAPVRGGLRDLVTQLRGQEVGYDDVRAALEHTTGQDLAELFRVWLYEKEIPTEFRARYESANETRP